VIVQNTDIALKGEGDSVGTFDVLAFLNGPGVRIDLNVSDSDGYTTFYGSGVDGRVSGADGLIGSHGHDHFLGSVGLLVTF